LPRRHIHEQLEKAKEWELIENSETIKLTEKGKLFRNDLISLFLPEDHLN